MKSNLKPIVKEILTKNSLAREDDFVLIASVSVYFSCASFTLEDIASIHEIYEMPSFESITRCRRSLQKQYPELVSEKAKRIREQEKQKYIEMSRKGEI